MQFVVLRMQKPIVPRSRPFRKTTRPGWITALRWLAAWWRLHIKRAVAETLQLAPLPCMLGAFEWQQLYSCRRLHDLLHPQVLYRFAAFDPFQRSHYFGCVKVSILEPLVQHTHHIRSRQKNSCRIPAGAAGISVNLSGFGGWRATDRTMSCCSTPSATSPARST